MIISFYSPDTAVTARVVDSQGHTARPCCLYVGQNPVTIMLRVRTALAITRVTAGLVSDEISFTFLFFFLFLLRVETNRLQQLETRNSCCLLFETNSSSYECLI